MFAHRGTKSILTLIATWTLAIQVDVLSISAETPVRHVYQTKQLRGWDLFVRQDLIDHDANAVEVALRLLERQLKEIEVTVPEAQVKKLKTVRMYFALPYPGFRPKAEYHPNRAWLEKNGRDTEMEKSIEFTNVAIFEKESRRMPNIALHELAHAYHDQQVSDGDRKKIMMAYQRGVASGKYDSVQQRDARGRTQRTRAYAMANEREYFAELSESFFSRNDFYPFDRDQLVQFDPFGCRMIREVWRVGQRGREESSNNE